jgi:hypothetical protein
MVIPRMVLEHRSETLRNITISIVAAAAGTSCRRAERRGRDRPVDVSCSYCDNDARWALESMVILGPSKFFLPSMIHCTVEMTRIMAKATTQ